MRYPKFLPGGGTVGFTAPSFGCNTEPYKSCLDNSIATFEKLGYKTVTSPDSYAGDGVGISTKPEIAAKELVDSLTDDTSDIVLSCGGGELMCEILDYVDFEKIKANAPKWFMGYSDNTNMTFLLTTLCDTASVYGPNGPSFGMEPWHQSITDAYELLRGEKLTQTGYDMYETDPWKDEEHPLAPIHATATRHIRLFTPKDGKLVRAEEGESAVFSGRLIGGCMDCLANLIGTKFDDVDTFAEKYKEDGFIWFLEACELNVFSIRRTLWAMKQAGWFKYVKGFMIGRPLMGDPIMNLDNAGAVMEHLASFGVPVILDLDIGHIAPMMPIISGAVGTVKVQDQDFELRMELK